MTAPAASLLEDMNGLDGPRNSPERGIWAVVVPALVEEILGARSTIVFVNSRGLAERLSAQINELAEEELAFAHHGSVSHEQRKIIEEQLKAGEIRAIVATSTMELGVDMGAGRLLVRRAWTVPILSAVRSPRPFGQIRSHLGPITDRALSQNLQKLEANAWVRRTIDTAAHPPRPHYAAINAGADICAAALAVGR